MAPLVNLVSRSTSSRPNVGIIAASIAGGVVIALLFASIVAVIWRRFRRPRHETRHETHVHNVSVEQGRKSLESSEFGEHKSYHHRTFSDVSMSPPPDSKPRWLYTQTEPQQYQASVSSHSHHTSYYPVAEHDGQAELQRFVEPLSNATPFMREAMTPQLTPGRFLPPLVIPSSPLIPTSNYISTNPAATIEALDSGASTPTSTASNSSESVYSQPSASTHMHHVVSNFSPPPPVPSLPPYLQTQDLQPQQPVQRFPTRVIGHLLKSRARQSSDTGPSRSLSKISRIERSNSIISVPSPTDTTADSIPSAPSRTRPVRQKSRKGKHVPMEPLVEAPDSTISTWFPSPSTSHQPHLSHSSNPSLTSAFRTSVGSTSSASHTSFTTAPSDLSRPEHESDFHVIDLFTNTPPLHIAPKANRESQHAKLGVQTQLDASATSLGSGTHVQDLTSGRGSRPGQAHLRDQIVLRVPSALHPARMTSAHATVEVTG